MSPLSPRSRDLSREKQCETSDKEAEHRAISPAEQSSLPPAELSFERFIIANYGEQYWTEHYVA